MNEKIDRSDIDYNTVNWREDLVTIARHSRTHVKISRHAHRLSKPVWTFSIDVTGGHKELHVAYGNRLACIGGQHMLAITCGEYGRGGSLHNYQLHYLDEDGGIKWSLPWQTIQRFTLIDGNLLIVRYVSPPQYWIQDVPLEAHLLDPETGDSIKSFDVEIPEELRPHFQCGQVTDLKAYLVWKKGELVVTVRPYFRPTYQEAHLLTNRGSFKHTLKFT